MTEGEIRKLIRESQKDGFRELIQQYKNYVFSIIWRRIRDVGTVEDTEECMNDVFAQVFMHFDDINEGSLQAYIATVSTRAAIDKFKELTASRESSDDYESLLFIQDDSDVEKDFDSSEQSELIYSKILSLGEPDTTLIIQKYYYGRNSKDIARMTGLSPVTVRVRINRALKRLKKLLTESGFSTNEVIQDGEIFAEKP